MYNFLYPIYFLLIIPIIIFLLIIYFKGGKKYLFGPMNDLKSIFKSNSTYYKVLFFILFFILTLYIIIFTNPVKIENIEKDNKKGIDIQIVLDISYSMIAEDLKPNRLEVAKEVIHGFLNKAEKDRIGIIVFAGKVFTGIPLNSNYVIIKKIVNKIDINTINQGYPNMQGTAIGDALIVAADSFGKNNNREKIIILLTDGVAKKGLDPLIALKFIKNKYKNQVKIYTIGIGGKEDTYIKIINGFGVTEKINIKGSDEKLLQTIAKETGGEYFKATNKKALENIFNTISVLEKREANVEFLEIKTDKYKTLIYLLIISFILLIIIRYKFRLD